MSGLDCVECGGYVDIQRPVRVCRLCEQKIRCRCPMRGAGDRQGCAEVRVSGSTPLIRAGDVLDGVIVVGETFEDAGRYGDSPLIEECWCACHE